MCSKSLILNPESSNGIVLIAPEECEIQSNTSLDCLILSMLERICRCLRSMALMLNDMNDKKCYVCGKIPLSKDEVGLTKKLIDKKTTSFYCITCLAEYLEVTEDELLAKVEEFKNEGCTLFK